MVLGLSGPPNDRGYVAPNDLSSHVRQLPDLLLRTVPSETLMTADSFAMAYFVHSASHGRRRGIPSRIRNV